MQELMKHTILGAAFDSSARDPPPRCHPRTRLEIVQRVQNFIVDRTKNKRMLWLVGPAGAGKSAIMQTLAESTSKATTDIVLGASLFFSINERDDGRKTFTTIAYQIAVRNISYRQFVQNEVSNDPSLLQKSIAAQFDKFIVEPFVQRPIGTGRQQFLIIIDGLDECNGNRIQCEILALISYLSIKHPAAPLVWIIASRPEPHITSFFSRPNTISSYEKEEITIDSDEARRDVERYLRTELEKIRINSPALARATQWPMEHDLLRITVAADGLFAFASTIVGFIGDPTNGNPVSQLKQVLNFINEKMARLEGNESKPMAGLDALYRRILFQVPQAVLRDAKRLLLLAMDDDKWKMAEACDWLAMTPDVVYGALHHLHSVLRVPTWEEAEQERVEFFHVSFREHLADFERSGMFLDADQELRDLNLQCAVRILKEIPGGTFSTFLVSQVGN